MMKWLQAFWKSLAGDAGARDKRKEGVGRGIPRKMKSAHVLSLKRVPRHLQPSVGGLLHRQQASRGSLERRRRNLDP